MKSPLHGEQVENKCSHYGRTRMAKISVRRQNRLSHALAEEYNWNQRGGHFRSALRRVMDHTQRRCPRVSVYRPSPNYIFIGTFHRALRGLDTSSPKSPSLLFVRFFSSSYFFPPGNNDRSFGATGRFMTILGSARRIESADSWRRPPDKGRAYKSFSCWDSKS